MAGVLVICAHCQTGVIMGTTDGKKRWYGPDMHKTMRATCPSLPGIHQVINPTREQVEEWLDG